MMRRCLLMAVLSLVVLTQRAGAADRVKLLTGTPNVMQGNITEMSATVVKLEQGPVPKKFDVNQIDYVEFDEDPKDLKNARTAMKAGKYAEALALINRIKPDDVKREAIKQDVEFYKGMLMAKLAQGGTGSLTDAGRVLLTFEKSYPNSYHYYEACELVGDLLVADKKYANAEPYYAKLASAPWPDYKIKAAVLTGRALELQKQYDKAIAKYEEAAAMDGDSKDAERQKQTAILGKATSLAASGKVDEAIKIVQEVIAKADPENIEVHARAYNALGSCYKKAGKNKEALMAYLHVDTLYNSAADQHAEALANLVRLWPKVDKGDRAAAAAEQLQEQYPNSRWAARK